MCANMPTLCQVICKVHEHRLIKSTNVMNGLATYSKDVPRTLKCILRCIVHPSDCTSNGTGQSNIVSITYATDIPIAMANKSSTRLRSLMLSIYRKRILPLFVAVNRANIRHRSNEQVNTATRCLSCCNTQCAFSLRVDRRNSGVHPQSAIHVLP